MSSPSTPLTFLVLFANNLSSPIPSSLPDQPPSFATLTSVPTPFSAPSPPPLPISPPSAASSFSSTTSSPVPSPPPPKIDNCIALLTLSFAKTSVTDPLAAFLSDLHNLRTLTICTAFLTGPIPSDLGRYNSLCNIYLYENKLPYPILP